MISFSADRPKIDPKDDLFNYAPFAKKLAEGICHYQDSDSMVIAIYSSWGSGKSTLLNYVDHYIKKVPENEQPVVVKFNPWWFSGKEKLMRAFFGQLQAVLLGKNRKIFEEICNLLLDYAETIAQVADTALAAYGIQTGGAIRTWVKNRKKAADKRKRDLDVTKIKDELSKKLKETKKRILVVIDDIDRLLPNETIELFTVIKAVADFPNMVYLLAFDHSAVTQSIEQQSGLPGDNT